MMWGNIDGRLPCGVGGGGGPTSCSAAPLAGPFLDGELPGAEARRFRAHLHRCPACRRELRALRRLSYLLTAGAAGGPWPTGPEDIIVRGKETAGVVLQPRPVGTRLAVALLGGPGYGGSGHGR